MSERLQDQLAAAAPASLSLAPGRAALAFFLLLLLLLWQDVSLTWRRAANQVTISSFWFWRKGGRGGGGGGGFGPGMIRR